MASSSVPEGVFSFLDTDLYKLTMQCAVLKYYSGVDVEYTFTNRTADMKLNKQAFEWLKEQVAKLANISLSSRELRYLRKHCPYLADDYLVYLQSFQLQPKEQVKLSFHPTDGESGNVRIHVEGKWVETILYEIPLLALTSEAYFKFVDKDWTHDGQEENAYDKGVRLIKAGCIFTDFGSRRRRDFETQSRVVKGLVRASKEFEGPGKLTGTSNVYMAMENGIPPAGTVAHEWYMGIAAISDRYENANELAMKFWLETFGKGVLGVALTDTFGTSNFFQAFKKPTHRRRMSIASKDAFTDSGPQPSYAEVFTGIRQDSGDPKEYIRQASEFYDSHGFKKQTIVFSDALNVDRCIEFRELAVSHGFAPAFGIGTFLTNDFTHKSDPSTKSKPLNIVIKLSKASGAPAIKLSDDIGKNTGLEKKVEEVKQRLGYTDRSWISEAQRW